MDAKTRARGREYKKLQGPFPGRVGSGAVPSD
jgi:hypothetical protein